MKPAETKTLYESACKSKRILPQQEEGEKWHKVLRDFEMRDVKAALDAWWRSADRDSKGDLKSKWLPEPAELCLTVQRERRKREVISAEPKVFVGWECPKCRYRCGGYVALDDTQPRVCRRPGCNTAMAEKLRERSVA